MPPHALDGLPRPPCAVLLGWEILDADPARGWVRIEFKGRPEFLNPAGFIQGGFLAAMLDDVMSPAAFIMGQGLRFTPTIDMTVSFLAPARIGLLVGEGQVVQLGRSIGFLEGRLWDANGVLVARSTATCRLVESGKMLG